jgi:hypothetical protein
VSVRGATVIPAQGKVGDAISVVPRSGRVLNYDLILAYVGEQVTSPRGVVTPAGRPYSFGYSRFYAAVDWTIRFLQYSDSVDPTTPAFSKLLSGSPLKTVTADRIDYLSGGEIEAGVPRDRFAFVAEGTANLPPGAYTLQVISDDGVRVWVDGKLALDAWAPHESRVDFVQLSGGRRRLRVEYYEATGWAEIRLDLQPRRTRN